MDLFESVFRRVQYGDGIEVIHTSASQVVIKNSKTNQEYTLHTSLGAEIKRMDVFKSRYFVAQATNCLLCGDLQQQIHSEVPWSFTNLEKFDFSIPNICLLFQQSEIYVIPYGKNDILGPCRTEFQALHLLSICVDSPSSLDVKLAAYLSDANTITVMNLMNGMSVATIAHDRTIDWLEVNIFLF